jgi:hypothetical protein
MNAAETETGKTRALAVRAHRELAERVYGHVIEAIDFKALFNIEQMLWCLLPGDEEGTLAQELVTDALIRAATSPDRACDFGPPPGITKAEAKAAAFDPDCPLCRLEAEAPEDPHDGTEDDPCELCRSLAAEWRAQHADVLRRAGLMPPASRN